MHTHQWFYQGKVIKIIDGNSIIIWVDLGFEIWKKVLVRFNRARAKDSYISPGKEPESTETSRYLEQNIKGKNAYFEIFRKKVYNGFDKYFAEVYVKSSDIHLRVLDVNKCVNSQHKIDGYVNLNDVMIGQGLATPIQFPKDTYHAQNDLHDRPPRKHSEIRINTENCNGSGYQSDSSGSGPIAQR